LLKLTYSNLEFQNFPGEDSRTPLFKGRGGKGVEGGERERIGERRDGKGRNRGWEGRGARHGLRPPRDKLWIRPCVNKTKFMRPKQSNKTKTIGSKQRHLADLTFK